MRICSELQARGLLCEAGKHPQVVRQDGYVGMDILPFLIAFFCWGGATSFKDFGKTCLGFGPALAAVCGRKKWPSPSSVRNPRRLKAAKSGSLRSAAILCMGAIRATERNSSVQ